MPDEPFRHAVAIAHAVPGAQLLLGLRHGGQLVVGRDDNADVRPCQLRHVLLAEEVHGELACRRHITSYRLYGGVVGAGPGMYRMKDVLARCFATNLDHTAVRNVIAQTADDLSSPLATASSDVKTVMRPDECLGVTVVVVVGTASDVVSDVTGRLAGGCLVDEVSLVLGEISFDR